MDKKAEGRQRPRRTQVDFPLLDLDVVSTVVSCVGSLLEGMTIVPSVPSVHSIVSSTTPSMFGTRHPSSSQSGGPRGDTMSVLSALTVPAALSGWTVFGGAGALLSGTTVGAAQAGGLGGGVWKELRGHPKMPLIGCDGSS